MLSLFLLPVSFLFVSVSVTMVCSTLLGFIMSMYIYICVCVYVYISICIFVGVCVYVYSYVWVYIYIYIYTYIYLIYLIFGEKHLWLWRPIDLILKIVSEFYHLIIFKLAHFILPMYRTLRIIGKACFSGLGLWKMNFFSHYFFNFSFNFLFIVTGIITMIPFIVMNVFVNAPGVVSICHALFVLPFILTIVIAVPVTSISFICLC